MGAAELTSSIVYYGWGATIAVHGAVLLILAWVLGLQRRREYLKRRRARLNAIWEPLLFECLTAVPDSLPALAPRDRVFFLFLWNHVQESIEGEASAQLNEVARRLGIVEAARQLLTTRSLRDRLLAITTLGRIRDRASWEVLRQFAEANNAVLSLEATRALVRIDPITAAPLVGRLVSRRPNWSPLKVTTILNEGGPTFVASTIEHVIESAPPGITSRLIRHLATTRCAQALPPIRRLMTSPSPTDDVLSACLIFLGECSDPEDLSTVRGYLNHQTWFIRMQAAAALGKMGLVEDEILLVGLLDDAHWWVRYRAAAALVSLPSMTEEKLAGLQASMPSLESQEIIIPFLAKLRTQSRAASRPMSPLTSHAQLSGNRRPAA